MKPARAVVSPTWRVAPISSAIVDRVADLHIKAFDGYPNVRLGKRFVASFLSYFATVKDPRESIAFALCGEDGVPVGYAIGAMLGYHMAMYGALAGAGLRAVLSNPSMLSDSRVRSGLKAGFTKLLGGGKDGTAPVLPDPTFCLISVGVDPGHRGRGVGNRLVEEFESECRLRSAKAIRLSVYSNNVPARRLYERRDWVASEADGPDKVYYSLLL